LRLVERLPLVQQHRSAAAGIQQALTEADVQILAPAQVSC
jgi:hypothetical protein